MISHDESLFKNETVRMRGVESMKYWMRKSKVEKGGSGLTIVYGRCSKVRLDQHSRKEARGSH